MFNTVKIQGDGFLVDGKICAPAVDGNPFYEEIKILMQGYRDVQVAYGVDADGKTIWTTVRETFEPLVPEPEFTDEELLQKAKDNKLAQILSDYEIAEVVPVLYNGTYYNGGEESATSIDKYVRLNRRASITSHTIWDVGNVDTTLTDTQADELLLAIGSTSSVNKFTLKNRKLALKEITFDALMLDGVTLKYPTLNDAIAAVEAV